MGKIQDVHRSTPISQYDLCRNKYGQFWILVRSQYCWHAHGSRVLYYNTMHAYLDILDLIRSQQQPGMVLLLAVWQSCDAPRCILKQYRNTTGSQVTSPTNHLAVCVPAGTSWAMRKTEPSSTSTSVGLESFKDILQAEYPRGALILAFMRCLQDNLKVHGKVFQQEYWYTIA